MVICVITFVILIGVIFSIVSIIGITMQCIRVLFVVAVLVINIGMNIVIYDIIMFVISLCVTRVRIRVRGIIMFCYCFVML